jgi:Major tropism determinant N-terminal domain
MATRMQQRRGTASQWVSSNDGDGPTLNAGEIGFETDTNKFKIGDGVSAWADLPYFADAEGSGGASLEDYIPLTQKGAVNGVAELDADGKLKSAQIPNIEEITQDILDTSLVAGTGLDKTYNDNANTYTMDIDSTVATLTGTQTLTGKTLTSPVISGLTISDGSIVIEGATANDFETTLTVTDPTADRTITFPDADGTVQLRVSNVDDTEIGYLNGVTSAIQTQMDLKAPLAGPAFTGDATAVNLTVSGNLTVDGTTTNINSTNLVIEDKNIVLGDTGTPTDTTADGGGITLKGQTDKTFNWVNATDAWTSSEHIDLASGKTLKYNGTDLVAAQSGNSGKYLTTDGTSTSWGTVSGYSAPTLGSTSIASGATVTTIVGLTKVSSDVFTTLDANGYEVDLEAMQIMGAL